MFCCHASFNKMYFLLYLYHIQRCIDMHAAPLSFLTMIVLSPIPCCLTSVLKSSSTVALTVLVRPEESYRQSSCKKQCFLNSLLTTLTLNWNFFFKNVLRNNNENNAKTCRCTWRYCLLTVKLKWDALLAWWLLFAHYQYSILIVVCVDHIRIHICPPLCRKENTIWVIISAEIQGQRWREKDLLAIW